MSLDSLYVLLGEVSVQILCLFFNCIAFLLEWTHVIPYIYWRSNPCLRYHWQICFPLWLVTFFVLMLFSLAMQELFILMRSHLFILSFMSHALGDISVKILLHGISQIFLPLFSSRILMVSWLIFKSSIHLVFSFVYCFWKWILIEMSIGPCVCSYVSARFFWLWWPYNTIQYQVL